jgi:hypothetical protein
MKNTKVSLQDKLNTTIVEKHTKDIVELKLPKIIKRLTAKNGRTQGLFPKK